jgi:hypothetical protein
MRLWPAQSLFDFNDRCSNELSPPFVLVPLNGTASCPVCSGEIRLGCGICLDTILFLRPATDHVASSEHNLW